MFAGLFPRFLGMFKTNRFVECSFTVASGNMTPISGRCYNGVTVTNSTGGLYILNLPRGVRNLAPLGMHVSNPDSDDPTDTRKIWIDEELGGISASTGKIYFSTYQLEEGATAFALAVPPDGSKVHFYLWLD